MLSRLVITFLPRSKRLLISWLQSPSAVILEPPKIKSDTVSTVSPSISHEVMHTYIQTYYTHLRSYICLHVSLCILVYMCIKLPYVLMYFSYRFFMFVPLARLSNFQGIFISPDSAYPRISYILRT